MPGENMETETVTLRFQKPTESVPKATVVKIQHDSWAIVEAIGASSLSLICDMRSSIANICAVKKAWR